MFIINEYIYNFQILLLYIDILYLTFNNIIIFVTIIRKHDDEDMEYNII